MNSFLDYISSFGTSTPIEPQVSTKSREELILQVSQLKKKLAELQVEEGIKFSEDKTSTVEEEIKQILEDSEEDNRQSDALVAKDDTRRSYAKEAEDDTRRSYVKAAEDDTRRSYAKEAEDDTRRSYAKEAKDDNLITEDNISNSELILDMLDELPFSRFTSSSVFEIPAVLTNGPQLNVAE